MPRRTLTHYVIVRADLPIGFLAAQVVHAAGESSPGRLPEGTNAVVLAVPNEAALRAMAERLAAASVAHVVVHEPDAPWNGQMTAIGLFPVSNRGRLRPMLSALPLLGKEAPLRIAV
jgi:peptidyl-tRNA hydrolase